MATTKLYQKNAELIQVVIELKEDVNPIKAAEMLKLYLEKRGLECYILDFTRKNNIYYVDDIKTLSKTLNLELANTHINNESFINKSYWGYRIYTRPQNCLTADIDSLENFNNVLVPIEAAELFNTANINESIKHIFRTFKFRKNGVNPEQYLSHYNFAKIVNGRAYILFHETTESGVLEDKKMCLLIENNTSFYKMLEKINNIHRDDESVFISDYGKYLKDSLIQFNNIYEAYGYLSNIRRV